MQLSDFDFELPQDRIALRPAEPRDSARLLVVRPGQGLEDQRVRDLPVLLRAGDILVVNETRVIPARLKGRRSREGSDIAVEATLHQRISGASWRAFMRPGKKIRAGDRLAFADLGATVAEKGRDGEFTLEFDCSRGCTSLPSCSYGFRMRVSGWRESPSMSAPAPFCL